MLAQEYAKCHFSPLKFEAAVPNLPEVSQVSIIEEPDGIMCKLTITQAL